MKRNLISVIILALSIINFIMLSVLVFSVVPSTKKTDNLITSIASVIDLSVEGTDGELMHKVDLSDLNIYTITNEDTITLKTNDSNSHYAVVQIAISMDKTSKDYKKYDPAAAEGIASKEGVIKATVADVLSQYTAEECSNNKAEITKECTKAVRELFGSDVIYEVSFSKYVIS